MDTQPDFPFWKELQFFRLNGRRPKKLERQLVVAAREFLPDYVIQYRGGSAICETPYGEYWFVFAIEMEQERRWNFPEFRAGYQYGIDVVRIPIPATCGTCRDANPYREHSRARSWDCGYILGLYEGKR